MGHSVKKGSQIAKNGFKNEREICDKFNSWENDKDAQNWLEIMGYVLSDIEYVRASVLHGLKADVNVQIQIKQKHAIDTENIQVKLVSNSRGFNQVDKRWLDAYKQMWDMPQKVYELLRYYTGELLPYITAPRDKRRMFMDEFTPAEQNCIVEWFSENKMLILNDIIRGRGQFSVEWILVAQKISNNARWVLININKALQHYFVGDVRISPKGTLYVGRVTVQRKGGDSGRKTACMLQFKLDPMDLFDV